MFHIYMSIRVHKYVCVCRGGGYTCMRSCLSSIGNHADIFIGHVYSRDFIMCDVNSLQIPCN